MSSPDITVVGGGAVGMSCALTLAERGASVTVLERLGRTGAGCSHENAGIVGVAHVEPLASLGSLKLGMRSMMSRKGPLSISPNPSVVPWTASFLRACSPRREARSATALHALACDSLELHAELGESNEVGYTANGFLSVYESEASLAAGMKAIGEMTIRAELLDTDQALEVCPQLAIRPSGAVFTPDDAHVDPALFVAALTDRAIAAGVKVRTGVEVISIRRDRGRCASLLTSEGELTVGEVVIASGAWAPELLPGMPVQGGKGYHLDYPAAPGDCTMPTWVLSDRVVATPFADRLRITGMLQVSGTDMAVDQPRLDLLAQQAGRLFRGVAERSPVAAWRGLRPLSPDGMPMIGRLPSSPNLILAAGHGMWGLQLAPVTGKLIGEILSGETPSHDLYPFRPERFRATS